MTDTYSCGIQMHRPEGDLYEILGIDPGMHFSNVWKHYFDRSDNPTPDERYALKALSDKFYSKLYEETRSTKDLYDAGFFDDGFPKLASKYYEGFDLRTRSFAKARHNIRKLSHNQPTIGKVAILITTGGFSPIHNGHIEMMEAAKAKIEADGYTVVGGFFAPGHDSYVGQKYNGTAAIPAVHRCAMVELATRDSDWLELDPYPSRYLPGEVNFTDVYNAFRIAMQAECMMFPDLFYVHGSDNAGFSKLDGYNGFRSVTIDRSEMSSKAAREGDHSILHPEVAEYLRTYKTLDTGKLPYLIRNEEDEAIADWAEFFEPGEMTKRRIQLQSTIRLGIAQMFKALGHSHKVYLLSTSDQRVRAREVIGGRQTISLDPFFEGTHRLDSTRYFPVSHAQFKPLYRAQRIGYGTPDSQASLIPAGEYVLVEDDSVTGETIEQAKYWLPDGVNVTDIVLLSDFADYPDNDYYDVVDMRDFIVGSKEGGLSVIISSSNAKARAPYALPYVSLRSRAKIPPEAEMEVSRIIWQANVRFFEGTDIRVKHASPGFRTLAYEIGYSGETLMSQVCKQHVSALLENI